MNNKISLTDLTDQLAISAKITKKEAGMFLKLLFELIEENLINDKIVKIKSLGTFKLIWVENRRIANVNTGEIQEIPGHYKTTFTPDAELSDAVNEPFAHLETVVLDDETIADEPTVPNEKTSTIITDSHIQENSVIKPEPEPESVTLTDTDIHAEPTTLQTSENEQKYSIEPHSPGNTNQERDEVIASSYVSPTKTLSIMKDEDEKPIPESETEEFEEDDEDSTGFKTVKRWIISLLIIILLAFLAYFLYDNYKTSHKLDFTQNIPSYEELAIQDSIEQRAALQASDTAPQASLDANQKTNQSNTSKQNVAKAIPTKSVTPATSDLTKKTSEKPVPTQAPVARINVTESKASLKNEVVKTTPKTPEKETAKSQKEEPKTYKSRKLIATEIMKSGSRLTLLAQKYYGNKAFWVYIYQANKNKIKNPNNVPVGTELGIPAKETYSIDPNNKESVDKAKKLASSISN